MKKNSYKLSYYALIILGISLISLLAGIFLFSRDPSSSYRRILTEQRIYDTLAQSVNDNYYSGGASFNYAIKSYKLKYFDQSGNEILERATIDAQKKKDELI